jgi:hypothetical protein
MRRPVIPRPALALALALVAAAAPSAAFASSQDLVATHKAIVAGYALARAGVATINPAQAKIHAYNRRLAAECPGVGRGTPETEASQPMAYEVAAALWSIAYGAAAGPIERFAKAMRPLHWTSPRLNRAAHALVTNLTALATIPLPDLCSDVRAWTASGFKTIAPHVLELDRHVEGLELRVVPWKLVAPLVRGRDARLVAYIKHAERKIGEAEFVLGQADWYEVLQTLELPP